MAASQTLLLFDIDGTLVAKASREHALALREAMQAIHGLDEHSWQRPADGASRNDGAGRTDGEIARMMLLRAGVDARAIDEHASTVMVDACERYAQLCPADLSDHVIPGIPALLQSLASRPDVRLSLVTGNYEPVARIKLARAGLGHWFPTGQGGFGSDSEDRTALPGIARERAGEGAVPWDRAATVVIGDTPRDIACARADGVRCVAVATGPIPIDELRGADGVAADAVELRRVLDSLL
jgi:phosphoglycolate phosphatase